MKRGNASPITRDYRPSDNHAHPHPHGHPHGFASIAGPWSRETFSCTSTWNVAREPWTVRVHVHVDRETYPGVTVQRDDLHAGGIRAGAGARAGGRQPGGESSVIGEDATTSHGSTSHEPRATGRGHENGSRPTGAPITPVSIFAVFACLFLRGRACGFMCGWVVRRGEIRPDRGTITAPRQVSTLTPHPLNPFFDSDSDSDADNRWGVERAREIKSRVSSLEPQDDTARKPSTLNSQLSTLPRGLDWPPATDRASQPRGRPRPGT